MSILEVIACFVAFLGLWGSLWYKLGKLTNEVKGHNDKLDSLDKKVERLIIRGG